MTFRWIRPYVIQDALREELIRRGTVPVGWKLAATGQTGQALFGIKEPISGPLSPAVYENGDAVSAKDFVALFVEAEFAFRMRDDLSGPGVSASDALAAVDAAAPALELADSSYAGDDLVIDAVANAALGKAILVGDFAPAGPGALIDEEAVFTDNGEVASTNRGADLMGDPINSLACPASQTTSSRQPTAAWVTSASRSLADHAPW